MQGKTFLVNGTPYCLFDEDVISHNKEFLKGLDAEFFNYISESHIVVDKNDPMQWSLRDQMHSPTALRLAYHHSLETLFSLIGIFLQAPECGFAWLPRCSTNDLGEIVRRISSGDATLFNIWKIDEMGWHGVANAVFGPCHHEQQDALVSGFSKLWAQLAGFFDESVQQAEYNSMKHGFRVQRGGVKISMSLQRVSDGAPVGEDLRIASDSKYGSGFFQVEKAKDGYNSLTAVRHGVNWDVMQQVNLNRMIYISINNLIAALRILAKMHRDESCNFLFPSPIESFDKAWDNVPEIVSFSIGLGPAGKSIPLYSKAQILEWMREHGHNV